MPEPEHHPCSDERPPLAGALSDLTLPAAVQGGATRHQAHLAALVDSLRSAGRCETLVQACAAVLSQSYADARAAAMGELSEYLYRE